MATHGWRTSRPLSESVRSEASRFDFYQLVRLLLAERGAQPELMDRHLAFQANLGAAFPGHEVRQIDTMADGRTVLQTGNYVLAGYTGPLPERLVEQMLERIRNGDEIMARFLDLFNQRINSLRYRLKATYRMGLNLQAPQDTPHARMLAAIMGMAAPGLAEQMVLPQRAWLSMAGLLADPRRSTPVLTRVLSRYLGAPVHLIPLQGAWRTRPEEDQTLLGRRAFTLGQTTRLGDRAWLPAARIALEIGPLPYAAACKLLPNGRSCRGLAYQRVEAPRHALLVSRQRSGHGYRHRQLAELIRFLLARRQDALVCLRLESTQAVPSRLTRQDWQPGPTGEGYWGMRLGQTAWLAGGDRSQHHARCLVRAFPAAGGAA